MCQSRTVTSARAYTRFTKKYPNLLFPSLSPTPLPNCKTSQAHVPPFEHSLLGFRHSAPVARSTKLPIDKPTMVLPKQLLATIESALLGPSPPSPSQRVELMHAIRSSLSSFQSLLSYPVFLNWSCTLRVSNLELLIRVYFVFEYCYLNGFLDFTVIAELYWLHFVAFETLGPGTSTVKRS